MKELKKYLLDEWMKHYNNNIEVANMLVKVKNKIEEIEAIQNMKVSQWLPTVNAYCYNKGVSLLPQITIMWYKQSIRYGDMKAQISLAWLMWCCQFIWWRKK